MRSEIGGTIRPRGTPPSIRMGACRPCWKRITSDKAFARRAEKRAVARIRGGLRQRVADVLGVSHDRLAKAIDIARFDTNRIDRLLGLDVGTFDRALEFAAAAPKSGTDLPAGLIEIMRYVGTMYAPPGTTFDPVALAEDMLSQPEGSQLLAEAIEIYRDANGGVYPDKVV